MSKLSKMIILIESYFWWDFSFPRTGYRNGTYLPLETIDDLLDQFNYTGLSDQRYKRNFGGLSRAHEPKSNRKVKTKYCFIN